MINNEFISWPQSPRNLTEEEARDPLLVLAEFFNDDWLPGQLEHLREWQKYVLADQYYTGQNNSPAGLLYFHRLNIRLIDAMYVLLQRKKICPSNSNKRPLKSDHLTDEKNSWKDYPAGLSEAELTDPYLVVMDFFNSYSLCSYEEMLYEWLEAALSSRGAREFIEAADLVQVYDNLGKLYAAAWIIYQRSAQKPYLKDLADELFVSENRDEKNS